MRSFNAVSAEAVMLVFKVIFFLLFALSDSFSFASESMIPAQITLCEAGAEIFESIPLLSISKIEVFLYKYGKLEINAEYEGNSILQLLAPLNLDSPKHIGSVGGVLTGKIILHFQVSSDFQARTKTFDISNGWIVEDQDCPGVLYFPSRKLDRSWLQEE